MHNQEIIKFEITFISNYWDRPPAATIFVDDEIKFDGKITDTNTSINFNHVLSFEQPHILSIKRYGKDITQCIEHEDGTLKDQILVIKQIKIDGINIQKLINTRSYYYPEYPKIWVLKQRAQGITVEESVIAETHLGHNGIWKLNFTSPFYQFLYDDYES